MIFPTIQGVAKPPCFCRTQPLVCKIIKTLTVCHSEQLLKDVFLIDDRNYYQHSSADVSCRHLVRYSCVSPIIRDISSPKCEPRYGFLRTSIGSASTVLHPGDYHLTQVADGDTQITVVIELSCAFRYHREGNMGIL